MEFDFTLGALKDVWGLALILVAPALLLYWLLGRAVRKATHRGVESAVSDLGGAVDKSLAELAGMKSSLDAINGAATEAARKVEALRTRIEDDLRSDQLRAVLHTALGALAGLAFGYTNGWVFQGNETAIRFEWPTTFGSRLLSVAVAGLGVISIVALGSEPIIHWLINLRERFRGRRA
jgi:hypothetical protein